MPIRRIKTITASSLLALGLSVPATANAATGDLLAGFDGIASQLISSADCATVRTTLTLIDQNTEGTLLTAETTRNQLSQNLQALGGKTNGLTPIGLAAIKYSGQAADRALACGIVKQDSPLTGGGSELSSKIADYAPALSSMLRGQ